MKIIKWNEISENERRLYLQRPVEEYSDKLYLDVKKIIEDVKKDGDRAVRNYSKKFDNLDLENFYVEENEIKTACLAVPSSAKSAIKEAFKNIEKFHKKQRPKTIQIETTEGVFCEKSYKAIESVGLYIPAGTAPLFSTVLMLAIPAKIAGCENVLLASPANENGEIDPTILYCANLCGIEKIVKLGGAQAIAAMAYGSESIKKVDKVFGPGNAYVTEAKKQVANDPRAAAQDLAAGPSELLVICDKLANKSFVAADLLSQAEHDKSSQIICLAESMQDAIDIKLELSLQIKKIARKDIAEASLSQSLFIIYEDLDQAMDISNSYCPEHLIINTQMALSLKSKVRNAGSVFIGEYSSESFGDYASGTNHVLPTYGMAKTEGGVDLLSFMKSISYQNITKRGFQKLATSVEIMADLEGLDAHKNAVSLRREEIDGEIRK